MGCCPDSGLRVVAKQLVVMGQRKTLPQAVVGFVKSTVKWVAAGAPVASSETQQARRAKCHACENYRHFMCALCRCVVAAKVKEATESCPAGKW